jgi:hypothetical protein
MGELGSGCGLASFGKVAFRTVGVCLPETPLAFLVAITSMKRVGELHALSVSSECYRMDPGGRSISLCSNPSFLPKILSDRHVNILLFCLLTTPRQW